MYEQNTAYMRYIKSKTNACNVIKGSSKSSNTLAAIYRMLYIKNNYCLYDSDRILYIAKNGMLLENAKEAYDKLKEEIEFDYITLFSFGNNRIDFLTIDSIVEGYFKEYAIKKSSIPRIIGDKDKEKIISVSLDSIRSEYRGLKLLSKDYIKFFCDEIRWIKLFDYVDMSEYQNCERTGRKYAKGYGPYRLHRNSRERSMIHKLFTLYEDKLSSNNMVDSEDRDRLALEEVKNNDHKEYTHIFMDQARYLTKNQLQLVKLLKNSRSYGEITYIYDDKIELPMEAFITKLNKISELNEGEKAKSYYFRKPFESSMHLLFESGKKPLESQMFGTIAPMHETQNYSVENFEFISLKNGREFKFIRDISRKDTIILVNDNDTLEIKPEEMKQLPVYSNIAAGEPIFMNPEMEDTFYIPQMWIKGLDNHFILQVKGDSMINAGINDGDHVIIKSSPSAQNRDIVAVDLDGSATLKRLMLKGNSAILMPENESYEPIPIREEGAHILGIAVGILKTNQA